MGFVIVVPVFIGCRFIDTDANMPGGDGTILQQNRIGLPGYLFRQGAGAIKYDI